MSRDVPQRAGLLRDGSTSGGSTSGGVQTGRPLRVGDDDRTRVAGLLGDHYAEGRLDLAEFDRRSSLAMSAVHQHELDALLADLPGPGRAQVVPPGISSRRARPRSVLPWALLVLLAVGLVVLTQGAALWFLPLLWWAAAGTRAAGSAAGAAANGAPCGRASRS